MNKIQLHTINIQRQIVNHPIRAAAWMLLTLLLISGLAMAASPAQAAPPAQTPDGAPSVSGGQSLWAENCLPCHGPAGQGDGPTAQSLPGPLPNFSDPATSRQHIPTELFEVIKEGRIDKMMPPWKNQLGDDEIWNAVAQVWMLGTSSQELAAGQAIYQEQCAACHGDDGSGSGPDAPAGINDFTDLAAMNQLSQADLLKRFKAGDQHGEASSMAEADIWASLNHIRTFTFALPQRNGVLVGQVLNAATNQPVGNIEVALHAFQNNSMLETLVTQADESGNFKFENLATEHSVMYIVEGAYQDIAYVSREPGMFLPDTTETTVNLEVFDTTTSDENINITQIHYLLSFTPDEANILQIFIVGNSGQETYIGNDGQTFSFALPNNATDITFQNNPNGERFVETGGGYVDTEPIMPSAEGLTIAALYNIPYNDNSLTVEIPLSVPAATMDVMMADQGASLSSNQVEFVENRDFQGNTFVVYTGKELPGGDSVKLEISGLDDLEFSAPAEAMSSGGIATNDTTWFNQEMAMWITVALGALTIVMVVVVYPMARPQLPYQNDTPAEDIETRQQKLLLTLARLDEAYENGEMDKDVYRQARAKYKSELAEIMQLG